MIGNPVRIKKYKELKTDHNRARWLAHAEYTVGRAETIYEETGEIVTKYYVTVGGIAVQTARGIFFESEDAARVELEQVEAGFVVEWEEVYGGRIDPIEVLYQSQNHHPNCQCRYCVYGIEALPALEY